jgi:PASTA domain
MSSTEVGVATFRRQIARVSMASLLALSVASCTSDTGEPRPSASLTSSAQAEKVNVPDVVGLGLNDARALLASAGLESSVRGSGEVVKDQDPNPGVIVDAGTSVTIAT